MKLSLEISHKKQLIFLPNPKSTHFFFLFLIFLSIFNFFISIYKMEPKSLKNICEKVIFCNINTPKNKDLLKKVLKERTLLTVAKKYKEKMKNEGNEYSYLLFCLKKCSYFYDDSWRSCVFSLAKEKDKKELLKNDRKIRNKMIQEEEKIKKYLIKNDFDVMKGFLEFFKKS